MPKPPCLRRSTLAFAAFVAWVLTLLSVPGESTYSIQGVPAKGSRLLVGYEHGWPWVSQRRLVDNGNLAANQRISGALAWGAPSWLSSDSWRFWRADRRELFPAALVGNLLTAIALLVGGVALWEWRVRRAGGVWRFGLKEMLLAMLAASCGLGWWTAWGRGFERETRAGAELFDQGLLNHKWTEYSHLAPRWSTRLFGTRLTGDRFVRVTKACFNLRDWDAQKMLPLLRELKHVTAIEVQGDWNEHLSNDFGELARVWAIKRIQYSGAPLRVEDVATLACFSELQELQLGDDLLADEQRTAQLQDALPGCRLVERDDYFGEDGAWFSRWTDELPW